MKLFSIENVYFPVSKKLATKDRIDNFNNHLNYRNHFVRNVFYGKFQFHMYKNVIWINFNFCPCFEVQLLNHYNRNTNKTFAQCSYVLIL